MSNFTSGLIRGALRTVPVAGGFVVHTAARERRWSNWSSAFAAAGTILAGFVVEAWAEGLLEEQGVISGLGKTVVSRRRVAGWETPGDLRRSGNLYGLGQWGTPGDLRRSGSLYGLGNQQVPQNVSRNWQSKGPLGLIEVRRYA